MRICSGPGCLRAVPDGVRLCDECKPPVVIESDGIKTNSVADRVRYHFLYSGKRWQTTQAIALRRCPFCAICEQAVSALVDHRIPAGVAIDQARESGLWPMDRYAGFYLLSNLQGLCRSCHWKKTQEDKTHSGPWPNAVDAEKSAPKRVFKFY